MKSNRKSKNLKMIVTPSTGSNYIDHDFCKKNKIEVHSLKDTDFVSNIYASV